MKNDERDTAETAVKNAVDAKVKYVLTIIKMKAAEFKAIIMEKVLNMKAHIVAKYHGRIHLNAEKEVVNGPAIVKTDIDVAQAKGGINKPASSKTYMYAAEAVLESIMPTRPNPPIRFKPASESKPGMEAESETESEDDEYDMLEGIEDV